MRTYAVAVIVVLSALTAGVGAAGAQPSAATTAGCEYPVTVTDETGTEVTVEEPPERVVTLGPASAQTMWELDAESQVVGVTQFAYYLDGAESRANVSGEGRTFVSTETVIAQEPDLVLAENIVTNDTVSRLRNLGVTVYKFRASKSIDFVYDKVNTTGQLVGACDEAAETVSEMQTEVRIVREAAEGQERPSALYAFFGTTAGPGSYIHEIITTAGADNAAADADVEFRGGYARINDEVVANLSVDWLILNSANPQVPDTPGYQNTEAVQQNRTVVVDENYISQPAPRIVQPMRKLAQTFHPEAYAEANATIRGESETTTASPTTGPTTTEEPTDSPTPDDPATDDGTTTVAMTDEPDGETGTAATPTETGGDGGGQPGFGPIAALVALVIGLTALRRQ